MIMHSPKSIYKDVVIIGNGPSGITLSYLLAGNVPVYSGTSNDEMLHARLTQDVDQPLVLQDIQRLADGLEGRSTNPVSVLLDALSHPDADAGFERPSLLTWQHRSDLALDHVVLGKEKAGGAWNMMSDGDVLTVSLGTWMELPNYKMSDWKPDLRKTVENRMSVSTVAQYYQEYVKHMQLQHYFENHTVVTSVRKIRDRDVLRSCRSNVFLDKYDNQSLHPNYFYGRAPNDSQSVFSSSPDTCIFDCDDASEPDSDRTRPVQVFQSQPESSQRASLSTTRWGQYMQTVAKRRAELPCCLQWAQIRPDENNVSSTWDAIVHPSLFRLGCSLPEPSLSSSTCRRAYSWRNKTDSLCSASHISYSSCPNLVCKTSHLWEVSGYYRAKPDQAPKEFCYITKNVVLAIGSFDASNLLGIEGENLPFVIHSLDQLGSVLEKAKSDPNPIMIVGAGLSAADAIIATMGQNIKLIHVFRRSSTDRSLIFNNLPAVIYPEYHKVHNLMKSKLNHELYSAYEKHHLISISADGKVKLHGELSCAIIKVSYVVVLIGSSPSLEFLSSDHEMLSRIGVVPNEPIGKNNPIDVDLFTHESIQESGLYALGPLVGDNFVRFLQGGALAVANHLLKKRRKANDMNPARPDLAP